MTPEEKFNQDVWWILQEIAGRKLATLEGKPTEFEVVKLIAAGIPSQNRQKNIIHKLQEWKAVKILNESPADWGGSGKHIFKLQLLEPKFTEIYKKFQKACDLTSYLNDYQERMVKGEDPPDFLHLKSTDDRVVAQTFDRKKHKGKMFETGSGGGYYNRNHPPRPRKKQSANEIVDEFSPENYSFVLMVLKKIASLAEFSTDNEVSYQLQSPFGQDIIKERALLKKFEARGLFKHLGEDGVFGITTLGNIDLNLVRQIITNIEEWESGVISEDKFEDIKKKYNRILQGLRERNQSSELKERYNKALDEIKSKAISSLTPQRLNVQEQNKPLKVEINLTDTSSRRAYEKKWDVLQAIWDVYESHSRSDSILVPVARLTIKDRPVELIDGITDGLQKEGLFQKWDRKDRWYNLEFINHKKLPEVYKDTGEIYKQFATAYQGKNKNDTSIKNQPNQSVVSFDDKKPAIIVSDKEVKIPYGTNQYYLCKAVFGNTKKRWENDELLDKFGANIEDVKVKRQPYDAMLAVNRKVKQEAGIDKLILCENKTFRLNPKYLL